MLELVAKFGGLELYNWTGILYNFYLWILCNLRSERIGNTDLTLTQSICIRGCHVSVLSSDVRSLSYRAWAMSESEPVSGYWVKGVQVFINTEFTTIVPNHMILGPEYSWYAEAP
jgi:hypothetical protein